MGKLLDAIKDIAKDIERGLAEALEPKTPEMRPIPVRADDDKRRRPF